MTALEIVVEDSNLLPIVIFWQACNYYEIRVSTKTFRLFYETFCEDTGRDAYPVEAPEFVEDYCLDVISNRCILFPKLDKEIE